MRRGREFSVHVAQNVSGVSFGPPGVLLKFGIGFAASSKSRLRRGSASASLSVTAGVCDWKEAIGLCVREVCLKIARQARWCAAAAGSVSIEVPNRRFQLWIFIQSRCITFPLPNQHSTLRP